MCQVITWVCMLALSQADAKPSILAPGGEAPEIGVVEGIDDGKLVFRRYYKELVHEPLQIQVKVTDDQNHTSKNVTTAYRTVEKTGQVRERHELDNVQVYDRDGAAIPRERWQSLFNEPGIVLFVRQGPDIKVDPAYLAAARPGVNLVVLPYTSDAKVVLRSERKERKGPAHLHMLLKLHNEQRELQRLPALDLDDSLCKYAQDHAEWMAQNQSMTHSDVSKLLGKYSTAGENIAHNQQSEKDVMTDWMNSSGHRANILNNEFSTVGFGLARKNGEPYWCTCFGRPQGTTASNGKTPGALARQPKEQAREPKTANRAQPRATLAARGVVPQLGIVDGIDDDSLVFRNIRPLSVYKPRNVTENVPVTHVEKNEDGIELPKTVMKQQTRTVYEMANDPNAVTRERHALDRIEVFTTKGERVPHDEWPAVFAQPAIVLFARFPKSGDDIQIEPAFQAAAQAGVPLVVLPVADTIEVVNEPSEADAANVAPDTVFARGGVAPQIGVVDSARDGKLVFQRIETASVSGNAQKTKYVSRATPETYDWESVEIYDRQGEPVARERWEQLFATPGIVLYARKGINTPVDPAFLAAAREGTFLVVLPEANKSQP